MKSLDIKPFPNCPALDGYHCQTNSLAKIYHHYGHPLSEDMLLGLGAGMGFMYWHQKGQPPFIGARGNVKNFYEDIGNRTGVDITEKTTSSTRRAEKTLLEKLSRNEPVTVGCVSTPLPGQRSEWNPMAEVVFPAPLGP